jgi:hypothetical protein
VDAMLQNINEECLWSVDIYQSHSQKNISSLDLEKHYNTHIFFTWSGQGESNITFNLISQLEKVIAEGLLTTHAHIFIVVTDYFDAPGQIALSIVESLWINFKIFDVLVLFPVSNPGLSHRDGWTRFRFYTWFPFHSPVKQIILIDECVIGKNGKWDSNKNLFPLKIPSKFQNYNEITVLTSEKEPAVTLTKNYSESNKTVLKFAGPEIDLLSYISETTNLSLTYRDLRCENATDFLTLMAKLSPGKVDLIVGGLPLHEVLVSHGEPSIPYYFTGYKWYVPCPKPVPRIDKISGIFYPSAWLSLIVSFVTVSVIMWGYANLFNKIECRTYQTLISCLYNVWAVGFGVSVHHRPITSELKAIFLLWVSYCYIMSTVFQIFFTSFLVDPGFEKPIQSYDELLTYDLEYGYGSGSGHLYFENYSEFIPRETLLHSIMCSDHKECLLKLLKDSKFATLQVEFFAKYFVTVYLPRKEHLLCSLPDYFRIFNVAMYLANGSHIITPLNRVIRRAAESGLITKWVGNMEEVWKFRNASILDADVHSEGNSVHGYFIFTVSHLQIAFMSLAVGLILGFVALLVEMLYHPNSC